MSIRSVANAVVIALCFSLFGALPSTALSAPSEITEQTTSPLNTSVGSASARVTWPVVPGAVAYSMVARAGGVTIAGSPPACNVNECVSLLSDLTGGDDYSITVVAVDSAGMTGESLPVSHRAISSPTAPTGLNVVAGSGSLTFSWLDPINLGGLPLLGYQLLSPNNTVTTLSATASSFVASGLNNGSPYVFTIRARNANGFSSPVSFSPATPVGVPSTPGRPTVASASGSVTVTWTAPPNGGQDITGYTVRLLQDGVVTSSAVLGPAARSHTFGGLGSGNFSARVIATNPLGDSDPSAPSATVTFGAALLSQVINFASIEDQDLSSGSLQLTVSATSNLTVSLASSGQCTVDSQTQLVTFTATGSCTITATQTGGSGFLAATPVPQSFTINSSASTSSSTATTSPGGVVAPGGSSGPVPVIAAFTTVSDLISSSATVIISGSNLFSVTSVQLGTVLGRMVRQSDTSITALFTSIEPGTHSLIVSVGGSKQTFVDSVFVRGASQATSSPTVSPTTSPSITASDTVSPVATTQKITIGTFRGFVAIYLRGYENERVSIKVAGRWYVVSSVPKAFHRVVIKTGAGYRVKSEVYVNRELVEERILTTR